MSKYVVSFLAALALVVVPGVAAQARPSKNPARAADLYPIPPANSPTPAAGAHGAVSAAKTYLESLSPAALLATGGPQLEADASGPGTFTFKLTAKIHGKTVVIGTGTKTVGAAGAVTVKIKFTKAGKSAMGAASGKLHLTVAVSFKPKGGKTKTAKSTVTLK
jgi:hypothetical protein